MDKDKEKELLLEIDCLKKELKEECVHNMELIRQLDKLNKFVYKYEHDTLLKEYTENLIKENTLIDQW